jgi:uncharacterized protein
LSATELERKKEVATAALRGAGSVAVALSGGVDSAVLLALAVEALGTERVLAVTGRSGSLPVSELEEAGEIARFLGVRHEVIDTREMERPGYRANAGDRCYHCRIELFGSLGPLARRHGLAAVAYGAILDDAGEVRPGMRAAREHGVLAPLLDAGITKDDVRRLAEQAGLPVWDKPAAACLASRIPVGVRVTRGRLDRIGKAEAALRRLGFRVLRVRDHGKVARIELGPDEIERALEPGRRREISREVRAAGFAFATIDLDGYRSGSVAGPPEASQRGTPVRRGGQ